MVTLDSHYKALVKYQGTLNLCQGRIENCDIRPILEQYQGRIQGKISEGCKNSRECAKILERVHF